MEANQCETWKHGILNYFWGKTLTWDIDFVIIKNP